MYDITKRKQFSTVGDLKKLLENIPDETQIVVTGDDYCWFHIEEDGSVVCLDVEELDDAYEGNGGTPCDYGDCPYNAVGGYDCRNYCGLGVDECGDDEYYEITDDDCPLGGDITNDCADCAYSCDYHYVNGECIRREEEEYIPSAENGDYSPSNPWDAPGMSIKDFI